MITHSFDVFQKRYHSNIQCKSSVKIINNISSEWIGEHIRFNNKNKDKNITLTPVTKNSIKEYKLQMNRINNGELHMWDDTQYNNSIIGDYFGYVFNNTKDKDGEIYIYEIINILDPIYSLSHWKCKGRNVLILDNKCLYNGPVSKLYNILDYKDHYKIQKTTKISESNLDKLSLYFDEVL
jgi:hypothetical protein